MNWSNKVETKDAQQKTENLQGILVYPKLPNKPPIVLERI